MSESADKRGLKRFKSGEEIVREGDYGDCMYIVREGKVRITKTVLGKEKHLADIGRDQFFGELSLINNKDRTATATALEDVVVEELAWETFQENIQDHPSVARRMIRTLARRMDEMLAKADGLNDAMSDRTRELEYKSQEAQSAKLASDLASEKLRIAQSRVDNILRSIGDGLLVLDADANVELANQAIADLLNVTQEDLVGKRFKELLAADDILSLTGLASVITGTSIKAMNVTFHVIGGIRKTLELTASLVLDDTGNLEGYVLVIHDLSDVQHSLDEQSRLYAEQKEMTDSLQSARDELERVNRKKNAFFQGVSHELRTPLTMILNPLERAIEEDAHNENLAIAARSARGLLRVVNQLLDFQSLASGDKSVVSAPLNLVQFALACGEHVREACVKRKLEFAVTLDGQSLINTQASTPRVFVEADLDALESIVFQFLSNALKFTPEGGLIELAVEQSQERARLVVRDTGPGIRNSKEEQLRSVLSGDAQSLSLEDSSTQLGLSICHVLADKMHGVLDLKSEPGKGSAFWLDLPLTDSERPLLNLLMVDDDPQMLVLLEHLFKQSDTITSVKAVSDTVEARRVLLSHRVQCVLCDGKMPGEDGPAFLSWLYNQSPSTTRVLMTGLVDQALLARAVNHAAVHQVLYKPVEPKSWITVLEGLIQHSDVRPEIIPDRDSFGLKQWLLDVPSVSIVETTGEWIEQAQDQDSRPLVLVVDPNSESLAYISHTLTRANYRVLSARDVDAAFTCARQVVPAVVMTDHVLGEATGLDLVKKFREDSVLAGIPIILLTAKAQEEARLIGEEAEIDGLLGKPFSDQELCSQVRNVIELKSKEREVDELKAQAAESVLRRYLPPDLVDMLLSGDADVGLNLLNAEPVSVPVTILFSDLCGFTGLTAKLRAVKVARLLNEYLTVMNDIIFEFGGTIDKFIGDAIMVLFGAPKGMRPDDQARAAADCALRMQEAMGELNKKWAEQNIPPLQMRIGVHHGPTVVGNFGSERRSDYTAIGPTVNMASRIESACEPGKVYVSGEICDYLPESLVTEAGGFELKGVPGEVTLYELVPKDS